jgi:hypothetical protein
MFYWNKYAILNKIVIAYTIGTRGIETELLSSFEYFSTFVTIRGSIDF